MILMKNINTGVQWPKIAGKEYPPYMVEVEVKDKKHRTSKELTEEEIAAANKLSQQLFSRDVREVSMQEIRALATTHDISYGVGVTKTQAMQMIADAPEK
jgi:hypothetical protein